MLVIPALQSYWLDIPLLDAGKLGTKTRAWDSPIRSVWQAIRRSGPHKKMLRSGIILLTATVQTLTCLRGKAGISELAGDDARKRNVRQPYP